MKSNRNVAKYIRKTEEETLLVVVNLSSRKIKDKRENLKVLISSYENPCLDILRPYEAVIYKVR